jgi:hypothetical protein
MVSGPVRRALVLVVAVALAGTAQAAAHAPTTAIGRAVLALEQVPVSYDPASAATEVEAANFAQLVDGTSVTVAFLPAAAAAEIAGGSAASIAEEIAREANLDGSLVVLVGNDLEAWSSDIRDERLAQLVHDVRARNAAGSPVAAADDLARTLAAEPASDGAPWGWIGAGLVVLATAALIVAHRRSG